MKAVELMLGMFAVVFGFIYGTSGGWSRFAIGLVLMFVPLGLLCYFAHRNDGRDRADCARRGGILVDHGLYCVKAVSP